MTPEAARDILKSYRDHTLAKRQESWEDMKLPQRVVEAVVALVLDNCADNKEPPHWTDEDLSEACDPPRMFAHGMLPDEPSDPDEARRRAIRSPDEPAGTGPSAFVHDWP